MRYNPTPLLIDREPPAFQTPSRFGDNPQSFPCNVVQRCAAADSCAATEPDPKEKEAAVQGETHPALGEEELLEMFIGASFMGGIADRYGRRPAFLVHLGIYSLFTFVGAFSINAAMLVASRFIAGIGIGAEIPLSDAYLSEVLPAAKRGRLMAWAYTAGFVGVPAAGLLARVLVPLRPLNVAGWRWLFVAGSLGGVIVWSLRRLLPESPKWLEPRERNAFLSRLFSMAGTAGERSCFRCSRSFRQSATTVLARSSRWCWRRRDFRCCRH